MASIHRRPCSRFWHAAFRGPDGRLILRSTKCTERAKAQAIALEFERASKIAGEGNLIEAQALKIVADIMERSGGSETLRAPSIEKYFTDWVESKRIRRTPGTAIRYKMISEFFITSLGDRAVKPLTALTARDVERFLSLREKKGLAPRTLVLDIKIIRTALNAARRQGLIPTNPADAVELPFVKGTGVNRGTFTSTEVATLVEVANGEWKTLILLAYFTGARLSDCCRMEWANLDMHSSTLKFVQGKTNTLMFVPIHSELAGHLHTLVADKKNEKFLMPHMASLKAGGRHGLSEGFKRVMNKAGLSLQPVASAGVRKLSRRTFHALRHSFVSALANSGVTPELRMKLTGHKSEAVHQGYSHHEMEMLTNALAKMPGLGTMASNNSPASQSMPKGN